MSITSINSNQAALVAQVNIGNANNSVSNNVTALSSGSRIVSASTDVAALSTGTALQSQVNALNTALTVASQGSSLLQVADGALAQIQSILQRQQSIATSAQSGSLSDTQRGFLDQEFQQLSSQINQLANTTNFNGVKLLNGGIQGGTKVNTNTTNGSAVGPVSATIATVGATVTGGTTVAAGDTYTLTVAGQPAITLTFGTATGNVGIGATAAATASNLASALNNSGLSQLANFRFQSSGTTVSASYTGSASSIANIPSLATSATTTATGALTATAAPSFTTATQIGSISGTVSANDTFTIGTHTLTFVANGSTAAGTNPTTGAGASTLAGNQQIAIGSAATAATATNTAPVTSAAVDNLVTYLNSVAGTTGFTDLTGLTFSKTTSTSNGSTAYALNAVYSGVGASQPTISTSYNALSPTNFGGGASQIATASSSVLTAANQLSAGAVVTIGGAAVTLLKNGTTPAASGEVALGTTLTNTLTALATYYNSTVGQTALVGGSLEGATFTSDGTHLYANNTNTTGAAYTGVSTTIANKILSTSAQATAVGGTDYATALPAGQTYANTKVALLTVTSGNIAATETIAIGTATFSINATGTTSGLNVRRVSDTADLAAIAAYLNTTAGQTASGISNLSFSSDATHLYALNGTDANITGPATVTYTGAATITQATSATITAQNGALVSVQNGGANATFTEGSTTTIGNKTITFVANGATPGVGEVALGANDTATLAAIATYLNANNPTTGGLSSGLIYTSNATKLYVVNNTGSALTPTIVSFATGTPASATLPSSATLNAASVVGTFSGGGKIGAGDVVVIGTAANNNDVANASTITTSSAFTIGGKSITFVAAGATATNSQINLGSTNAATLTNLVTYLNTNKANLVGGYQNLTYSSDGINLIATNASGSSVSTTSGNDVTFSSTPAGATSLTGGLTVANNEAKSILTLGTAPTIGANTAVTIGGATIQFGSAAQVTAGTKVNGNVATVAYGNNNFESLTNLATYLNSTTGQAAVTGTALNGATFTTDGTHLIATNNTLAALTGATGANAFVTTGGDKVSTGAVGLATFSTLNTGSSNSKNILTLGVDTLVFGTSGSQTQPTGAPSAATLPTSNVSIGATPTLATALANAATYLNSNIPTSSGSIFSSNGTQLLAQNSAGSTSTLTTNYSSKTTPVFSGVTGAVVTATSSVGLGAGVTSAVGTPVGNLFVSSTGTTVTNYGKPVDLALVANNASFVGSFGGSGSIGAIKANYVNTGVTSTSGVQFSVVVGNDTYTTNTITNANLSSATAPVALAFTGSNTVTSAAEGGSFTLNLQPQANVTSQNQADQLAGGINSALSSVSAYQDRSVLSYNNNYSATVSGTTTATLQGSSLTFNSSDFSNPIISSVSVSAPSTGSSDAKISVVLNGDTYSTIAGIGNKFNTDSSITLQNTSNPTQTLTLTTGNISSAGVTGKGNTAIDLSSSSNASAFQTALSNALGLNNAGAGLSFQVGATSADSVGVSIGSATSSALFGGQALD
ncbi:MAG: hypothetical protein WCL35_07765, partial [bacterium]